jgi:hypothetical protein
MTEERANDWCENNRKQTKFVRIPSVWNYSAVRNLGISRDIILKTSYHEINNLREKHNLTDIMIGKYYNKAMDY